MSCLRLPVRREVLEELLGKMRALGPAGGNRGALSTGLELLDEVSGGGGLARGAVHELLSEGSPPALFPALVMRAALKEDGRKAIWCDGRRELYPPALRGLGVPLDRLVMLQPGNLREELWAMNECLRCRGVAICVGSAAGLGRVEARRLQLAAERGGGVGILLRPLSDRTKPYAAASRWIIHPAPGERMLQRWRLELIHGQGGRVGKVIFLELSHEPVVGGKADSVRAVETVADRSHSPQRIFASA